MDLAGKVALITGGAKRVGQALALALAGHGCNVVVHYGQSGTEAGQTAAKIRALNVKAWAVAANLAAEAEIKTLVPFTLEHAGRLDILINNASIFPPEDFMGASSESWDRNHSINLKAPFLLSQDFARALPPGRQGKIINLLDATAMRPKNHHFSYTVSKYGLEGLTLATAHALAGRNIQVNGIALGAILPSVNDERAMFDRMAAKIPAKRTGNPQDVVNAMLYLIQAADFVTGEIIRVDGGKHLV